MSPQYGATYTSSVRGLQCGARVYMGLPQRNKMRRAGCRAGPPGHAAADAAWLYAAQPTPGQSAGLLAASSPAVHIAHRGAEPEQGRA